MFAATPSAIAARLINHLLGSASWASEKLQAHAHKSFEARGALSNLRLGIAADGLLQPAPADAVPAVSITLSAGQALRLMAGDKSALKDARVEGDAEFAAALSYVAEHLEWDFEEDLSHVVGDVAAHRLAGAWRQAKIWRNDSAARSAETVKEYLTEEQPLIAKRESIEQFAREVDRLRDDVERLAKRIEKL